MLSHFRFRQLLESMSKWHKNNIIYVNESYTSQTCGLCGNTYKIGGKRKYECKKCGFEEDRDVNGARNICIKFLTDNYNFNSNMKVRNMKRLEMKL